MTLQERLREYSERITRYSNSTGDGLVEEAADALDAKDARIKELEGALRECADDLEAELTHRYCGLLHYTVMKRRYDSEMATVQRAREALK